MNEAPHIEDQQGLIKYLEDLLKKKRLTHEFVSSAAWDIFKEMLEEATKRIMSNLANPNVPNVSIERGKLIMVNQIKQWSELVSKDIKLLQVRLDDIGGGEKQGGGIQ